MSGARCLVNPSGPAQGTVFRVARPRADATVLTGAARHPGAASVWRRGGRVSPAPALVEHAFARLWCPACRTTMLCPFSCRGRSFCPSCEKKRQLLWAEWLQKEVLAPVPHRHVVLTMPRLLRGIFRKRRELLLDLSQCAAETVAEYVRIRLGPDYRAGIVCRRCGGPLKPVAYTTDSLAIRQILEHLELSPPEKPPPEIHDIVRVAVGDEGREIEVPPP